MTVPTTSVSADDRWELFGVVMQAVKNFAGGTDRLLSALEDGSVAARATLAPPPTGISLLDAAANSTPVWWLNYKEYSEDRQPVPPEWAVWAHTHIEIAFDPVQRLLTELHETERHVFDKQRHHARSDDAWSVIEALAWHSAHNLDLVASVRAFGHLMDIDAAIRAQPPALRFLHFHVACHHCHCGSSKPLLPLATRDACQCVLTGWRSLIADLKSGHVPAILGEDDGKRSAIEPQSFLAAKLDAQARQFTLVGSSTEVIIDRCNFVTKSDQKYIKFNDKDRQDWIKNCPQMGVDEAFKNFKKHSRWDGTNQESFRNEWRGIRGKGRGRPKKS